MKPLIAALLLFTSVESFAGSQQGRITALRVREYDGIVWINIEGTRYDKPACAAFEYWMIKDENSEAGKKQYAMLLAALMSGNRVGITGTNTCTRWPDGEDIMIVEILPN